MTTDYVEYTIKIKDEKTSLSEKEFCYSPFLLSKDNALLQRQVESLATRFIQANPDSEAPEIKIKATLVWQS